MLQKTREPMDHIWQQVRNLHIEVPRALNPEMLPLQIDYGGQLVMVTEIQFDYKGGATDLQVGVGWKATALRFNNGDNLIGSPRLGWGHSPRLSVDECQDWTPQVFNIADAMFPLTLPAPVPGINTSLDGLSQWNIGYGREVDTWIWIYDVDLLGWEALGPDEDFLEFDTDSGVIRMPIVVPDIRDLQVGYDLYL